jgi:hypothetical protein
MPLSLTKHKMIHLPVERGLLNMVSKRHGRAVLISIALAMTSCAGQRTTYLPDGRMAYAISCRGFLNSWQSCLIKAGRICGMRGYQPIRSEEYDRELLIACNPRGSH